TTGWVADTTAVGELSLPEDSWKTIIRFVGGKDATGTVWTDDYMMNGRNGWLGQDWNTQLGVPTGWFYWLPPIGGNDGVLSAGYENTKITDEYAYNGNYSLKFDIPVGTRDGFVGTRKFPLGNKTTASSAATKESHDITALNGIVPGDILRISVWIKGMNLKPDSAAAVGDAWSVALTPMFHNTMGNNAGFGDFWASDIPLKFPNAASFDWKQFYVDVPVQDGAVALSVRLHPLGRFQGTVYMDQLEITKNGVTDISNSAETPTSYSLSQNYPNPFNPSTIISYSLPTNSLVRLVIYDLLGREVKTLINSEKNSGTYQVQWNGDNNFGSKVASGTYIYMIRSGDFNQARKLILSK
ncbi:MAG: T9SS type A sorting domain-containing protein, partial [Ignavibacteria bacterium]|nr:T9SS type A sorting domain-containing protein [Ignavibacteria bacterium]